MFTDAACSALLGEDISELPVFDVAPLLRKKLGELAGGRMADQLLEARLLDNKDYTDVEHVAHLPEHPLTKAEKNR